MEHVTYSELNHDLGSSAAHAHVGKYFYGREIIAVHDAEGERPYYELRCGCLEFMHYHEQSAHTSECWECEATREVAA